MLWSVSMIVSEDNSGAYPLNIQSGSDAKGTADLKKCVRFSYAFLSYRMKGYAIIPCDEFSCPQKFTNRDTINWTFRGKNRTIGLEHKEVHYGRINVYESGRLLHSRSDT